ncbi:MAG TPA: hypothetical protein VF788_17685, partial [Pseudonocardiaceae bacterium]
TVRQIVSWPPPSRRRLELVTPQPDDEHRPRIPRETENQPSTPGVPHPDVVMNARDFGTCL